MRLLLMVILVSGIAAGCSDSNTASTNSTEGITGTLFGTVGLLDYRGRSISDKSGVLVQFEGTSFSASTDTSGTWVVHNLPTRAYTINFSKPGFFQARDRGYVFIGGDTVRYRTQNNVYLGGTILSQPPRFGIIIDAIILPQSSIYKDGVIYIHTTPDTPDSVNIGLRFIAGKNPALKLEDKSSYALDFYSYQDYRTPIAQDTAINIAHYLDYSASTFHGFSSSDTLYFRVYAFFADESQYNPVTDRYEAIGYGAGSNVLSAVMP